MTRENIIQAIKFYLRILYFIISYYIGNLFHCYINETIGLGIFITLTSMGLVINTVWLFICLSEGDPWEMPFSIRFLNNFIRYYNMKKEYIYDTSYEYNLVSFEILKFLYNTNSNFNIRDEGEYYLLKKGEKSYYYDEKIILIPKTFIDYIKIITYISFDKNFHKINGAKSREKAENYEYIISLVKEYQQKEAAAAQKAFNEAKANLEEIKEK